MSLSYLRRRVAGVFPGSTGRTAQRRARSFVPTTSETLEKRLAMSAVIPAIQMLSAATTDSKSVTIKYQVNQVPSTASPIQFGVYRSSDSQFDSSDSLVDTVTLATPGAAADQSSITVDQSGVSAVALGTHELTIPLPQGLSPFPEKPYVLVVADPNLPSCDNRSPANRILSRLHDRHRDSRRNSRFKLEARTSVGT